MEPKEIDWMALSRAGRQAPTKKLYSVLRKLHVKIGGRFDDLFVEAQGAPMTASTDPYSNIKRGDYDRAKTRNIHEWLATHHFDFGQQQAPELFQHPRRSEWDLFIEQHLVEGGVRAVPLASLGIARRSPPDDADATFRMGQPYGFHLEVARPCYVVAFEAVEGKWHPFPLDETETSNRLSLDPGTAALPQTSHGTPIGIAEFDDAGIHTFVFVLGFGPKPHNDQKSLIAYARQHEVALHQKTIRFAT